MEARLFKQILRKQCASVWNGFVSATVYKILLKL
jgi:hypothetical protein